RDGRLHPDRRGHERHRRRGHDPGGLVTVPDLSRGQTPGHGRKARVRTADPYRDTAVIDSRAPRFNQAVLGVVALLAVATGWWWLLILLAANLASGLTFGRRFCL